MSRRNTLSSSRFDAYSNTLECSNVDIGVNMDAHPIQENDQQAGILRNHYKEKIEAFTDQEILEAWSQFTQSSISRPFLTWLNEVSSSIR